MKAWTRAAVQGAACGLVLGAVLLVGRRMWQPPTAAAEGSAVPDVVRARSFELVDKERGVVASLAQYAGFPTLTMRGYNFEAHLYPQGLDLRGPDGVETFLMGGGAPGLALRDSAGELRAALTVALPGGDPTLRLWDSAGELRVALDVAGPGGGPALSLWDCAGELRAAVGTTPVLETIKTGETTTRPESSLVLFDKNGKVLWRAP